MHRSRLEEPVDWAAGRPERRFEHASLGSDSRVGRGRHGRGRMFKWWGQLRTVIGCVVVGRGAFLGSFLGAVR
jgi:hypothetical protein